MTSVLFLNFLKLIIFVKSLPARAEVYLIWIWLCCKTNFLFYKNSHKIIYKIKNYGRKWFSVLFCIFRATFALFGRN